MTIYSCPTKAGTITATYIFFGCCSLKPDLRVDKHCILVSNTSPSFHHCVCSLTYHGRNYKQIINLMAEVMPRLCRTGGQWWPVYMGFYDLTGMEVKEVSAVSLFPPPPRFLFDQFQFIVIASGSSCAEGKVILKE